MKISIDQIPESGLEINESCESSSLDLDREDIKFTEPINLSAQVSKEINTISLRLKIEAIIYLSCSRCLEEYAVPLSRELRLDIPIEDKKMLDLTDNIREEVILSYPLKSLCHADCLGLCPVCGKNLNKGRCNHGATKEKAL